MTAHRRIQLSRKRAALADMDGLMIRDTKCYPHAVELTRWSEEGLIEMDLDQGVYRLTAAGEARLKVCCATCGSWHRRDDLPDAAGGPVGECHHDEHVGEGMHRLRPPLYHYYRCCECHWPKPATAREGGL